MSDIFDDPEFREWLGAMNADSGDKIKESRFGMMLWEGQFDPMMAFQVGCMVTLDKPIIGLVMAGAKVPPKLAAVMDEWVEWTDDQDAMQKRLGEAIERVVKRLDLDL